MELAVEPIEPRLPGGVMNPRMSLKSISSSLELGPAPPLLIVWRLREYFLRLVDGILEYGEKIETYLEIDR